MAAHELAQLKAENERLKAENERLKAELADAQRTLAVVQAAGLEDVADLIGKYMETEQEGTT